MDRDFGFILEHLWHGTTNYHVIHHHFNNIPFYHAREATEAIKKVMGDRYMFDNSTSLLQAFWNNHRVCKSVTSDPGQPAENEAFYFDISPAKLKSSRLNRLQSVSVRTNITSKKRLAQLGHMVTPVLQHQDVTDLVGTT
jgi:hypothetical protein